MTPRLRRVGLVMVVALLAAACVAIGPGGEPQPIYCPRWRYDAGDEPAPGVLPAELDRDSYKVTSARDTRPELYLSPHNHCGQKGPALDLAFGVTKGRDDVTIAVLDSGIKWRDAGAMADLATKAYLNLGEARPPCASTSGDCNGDGRFDIGDFSGLADHNGNGLADPEDVILDGAYSDGVDDDGNGYVDDISGWDLLYGDNNPLDTVEYGHGTGEAQDSTAAENGTGDVGTCPNCRFLPVRVSDSFIADGSRFAAGVLFALDSGADVVQGALGAVSNPPQAQQAIDAAYRRGVVVVASMADEAAKHANLPSSLEHTMAVNSVTEKEDIVAPGVQGYLALNGCTNYGARTFLAIPSGSCSSEATGRSAGMVGLIESVARDNGHDLSANEVMQVLRATADDIDFATPNAVDPANDFGTSSGGLLDTVRYPTRKLWDATFGYGRVNIYEAVKAVRAGRIPPEADISSPRWFRVAPTEGRQLVQGRVAAPNAEEYEFRVEWAVGLQTPPYPAVDDWHVVARRRGLRRPFKGVLGAIDLADIAAALPDDGTGSPVDPATGRPDEERFSVRVRVVVTGHGGAGGELQGEHQKQLFVHDDPDLVEGYPQRVAGARRRARCSPTSTVARATSSSSPPTTVGSTPIAPTARS
ncbi:MAG: S8 family serine peptidase [Acidimicrobiales bacterium]